MNISYTEKPEKTNIELLYINASEKLQIHQLVNACWFTHQLHTVNNKTEEDVFFQNLAERIKTPEMYEAVITDFRKNSPLSMNRKLELIERLRQARCPLISLNDRKTLSVLEEGLNWVHISLPAISISRQIPTIKEIMTNYWFCLPSK